MRPGFPYKILDPIPPLDAVGTFDQIADSTGEHLLRESVRERRGIQVLWSGGIDSTVALIALCKAAFNPSLRSRIEVVCSGHSIAEYPRFFSEHIAGKLNCQITTGAVGESLDDSKPIVTGEHGDQIFGSLKLQPIFARGEAQLPYRSMLFQLIDTGVVASAMVGRIVDLLQRQVDHAPVRITTVYDYFWWLNFSLKWQHVTLRVPVYRGERFWPTYLALRHFFRGRAFQLWALTNPQLRTCSDWSMYKEPAKLYILNYTSDQDYFASKRKEPSLQNVLVVSTENNGPVRVRRISWRCGQRPRVEYFYPPNQTAVQSRETP